jgi:hypothetical protein
MRPHRGPVVVAALLLATACGPAAPVTVAADDPTPSVSARADGPQEYRTVATVVEEPDGPPRFCHVVEAMYPPRCGGPEIVGWDWNAVRGEESANGITWVEAELTGTWDWERFMMTRAPVPPPDASEPPDDPARFAPRCAEPDVIDPSHGRTQLPALVIDESGVRAPYDPTKVAGMRVSDPAGPWDGPFVATVVVRPGSASEVTASIREHYLGPLCVVERDQPTIAQLLATHRRIRLGYDQRNPVTEVSLDQIEGVVRVTVFVADRRARERAHRRWGPYVRLEGLLTPMP